MSRWIEDKPDGGFIVRLDSEDQCKWMYNEVCCNDRSPFVADWPDSGYCERCPLYEQEDMEGIHEQTGQKKEAKDGKQIL
mgnify:CR=1 FL=1